MSKAEVVYVAPEALKPFPRNARVHPAKQIDQIVASIRQYGFTAPVLLGTDDTILAGHGRVLAALKLKIAEIPCVRIGHLSAADQRAYVLADNKIATNSNFDLEIVAEELKVL